MVCDGASAARVRSTNRAPDAHVRRRGTVRITRSDTAEVISIKVGRLDPTAVKTFRGTDSRTLQSLVTVAARNGFEIRDPFGHLIKAADRLNHARGYVRHRARVQHQWIIELSGTDARVPPEDSYRVEQLGWNPDGRRVAFRTGVEFDICSCHAL